MTSELVLEIETIAFRAWPAEEVVELAGWRLRFMHGVTRRANSVWPNALEGDRSLVERVEAVEAFARSRGIPPSFQITSAARPAELDAFLAERGYVIDAPVSVQTLALDGARPGGEAPELTTSLESRPNDAWLSIAIDRGRYASSPHRGRVREHFLGLLARIGDRAGFALVRVNGEPAAIGLGVVDGAWLGVFGMLTVPEARRRGAARAALAALASWGRERGATSAYLQVERENERARSVYAAAGFVTTYDYHYRTSLAARDAS